MTVEAQSDCHRRVADVLTHRLDLRRLFDLPGAERVAEGMRRDPSIEDVTAQFGYLVAHIAPGVRFACLCSE